MAELQTKRHPIRGALYGLILGLSVWYFLQFEFATFGLDSVGAVITRLVIIVVAGMAVGVLWAYVAPARKPKEPAPAAAAAPAAQEPPPAPSGDDKTPPGD
jgi:hypothetical protein